MERTMTPSSITAGQIGKFQELFGAGLRKSNFMCEPTQHVLETQGDVLIAELVTAVRKYVEAASNIIVRHVKIDRRSLPQQVIDASGRVQCTDQSVVNTMPRGEGEEADVYFFKVGRYIGDLDLEKEYELRGFKPDPLAQAQVNINDSAFADGHPNGTHWQDGDGKWCFASFFRSIGERLVDVDRRGGGWGDRWWFGGVRK